VEVICMSVSDAPVYLCMCVACGGPGYAPVSMFVSEVPPPRPYYCPKCAKGLLTGEEQLAIENPELSLLGEREGSRWCVLERRGDGYFLARRIGFPDSPSSLRHVGEIRPKFSYQKLARGRHG
jgi:hypothetical protein